MIMFEGLAFDEKRVVSIEPLKPNSLNVNLILDNGNLYAIHLRFEDPETRTKALHDLVIGINNKFEGKGKGVI